MHREGTHILFERPAVVSQEGKNQWSPFPMTKIEVRYFKTIPGGEGDWGEDLTA